MELKIKEYTLPEQILFNFEELKTELSERVKMYETLVYTDDKIKEAKADKANLNKLKKALNDERIRREKEYMAPFKAFKAQVDEIISIIDKPITIIDKQVKEYEEAKKSAKKKEILAYMATIDLPYGIDIARIFDLRWLNATASMTSVKAAIDERAAIIQNDLKHLETLGEYSDIAITDYFNNMDLRHALDAVKKESDRREMMAKVKAEREAEADRAREAQKALEEQAARLRAEAAAKEAEKNLEPVTEPQKPAGQWVNFSVFLDIDKARKLKEFFNINGYEFKRI